MKIFLIWILSGLASQAYCESPVFSRPLSSSCLNVEIDDETDNLLCDERQRPQEGSRPYLIVPGIYQNFNDAIGAEISVIHSIFGLSLGIQDNNATYLEGELVVGPISIGFGPRLKDGKLTPQTTVALPFFYIFPYWRWISDESTDNKRSQEFGIMLKFPLEVGPSSHSKGRFHTPTDEGVAI